MCANLLRLLAKVVLRDLIFCRIERRITDRNKGTSHQSNTILLQVATAINFKPRLG